jgi:deazaflavin-dependent oxidoreductase (nitroreductase family)
MPPKSLIKKPPTGLLRIFLRLPILLYRLKLGWLLGGRFVLLNHVGRKSGKIRQTVVEVIEHDKAKNIYYIASGWGYNSNWYQNLLATPAIRIQVGLNKLAVIARTLPPAESVEILLSYRVKHPFAARELSGLMGLGIINAPPQEIEKFVREDLPILALCPDK